MIVKNYINSIFNSVSYRLGEVIIDPGDEWEGFYDVSFVLLTHAHFDHIYGLNRVIELNPEARVFTNECGREMLLDAKRNLSFYQGTPFTISNQTRILTFEDGEVVVIGEGLKAKAIFTPGHNPSCITWLIGDALFTGDAYIPGIKTVTNLPGSNKKQAEESLQLIKGLSVGKELYPGHNLSI